MSCSEAYLRKLKGNAVDVVLDFLFSRWFGVPLLFGIGFGCGAKACTASAMKDCMMSALTTSKTVNMGIVAQTWSLKPQHRLVVQPYHRALFHVDGRHGFCAVMGILKWELSNWFSEERALLWPVALLAILAGVMCHCANPIQEPFDNRRRAMGLDIEIYKDTVYTLYQRIAVQHDYWQLGDKAKDQFHLDWLRFAPKLMVMGAILWYGIMMTWAAALLILTLHENVFG